jgi:hypothetical protein
MKKRETWVFHDTQLTCAFSGINGKALKDVKDTVCQSFRELEQPGKAGLG